MAARIIFNLGDVFVCVCRKCLDNIINTSLGIKKKKNSTEIEMNSFIQTLNADI